MLATTLLLALAVSWALSGAHCQDVRTIAAAQGGYSPEVVKPAIDDGAEGCQIFNHTIYKPASRNQILFGYSGTATVSQCTAYCLNEHLCDSFLYCLADAPNCDVGGVRPTDVFPGDCLIYTRLSSRDWVVAANSTNTPWVTGFCGEPKALTPISGPDGELTPTNAPTDYGSGPYEATIWDSKNGWLCKEFAYMMTDAYIMGIQAWEEGTGRPALFTGGDEPDGFCSHIDPFCKSLAAGADYECNVQFMDSNPGWADHFAIQVFPKPPGYIPPVQTCPASCKALFQQITPGCRYELADYNFGTLMLENKNPWNQVFEACRLTYEHPSSVYGTYGDRLGPLNGSEVVEISGTDIPAEGGWSCAAAAKELKEVHGYPGFCVHDEACQKLPLDSVRQCWMDYKDNMRAYDCIRQPFTCMAANAAGTNYNEFQLPCSASCGFYSQISQGCLWELVDYETQQGTGHWTTVTQKKVLNSCHVNYKMPAGDETKGYEDRTFDEKGCREMCLTVFHGKATYLDSCMQTDCRQMGF